MTARGGGAASGSGGHGHRRLRSELHAPGFENLRVVARDLDTGLFEPVHRSDELRRRWGAPAAAWGPCMWAASPPKKKIDTLLAARVAMQQRCPQAHFAGLQRGQALPAHCASADVFPLPSVTETWGNVRPEAMASGLAVVAFDCAAAGQMVRHGHNGLLARVRDDAGFCGTAARLAGALGEARALGSEARLAALKLDWGRIAREVEGEYLAAMATHPELRPASLAAHAI